MTSGSVTVFMEAYITLGGCVSVDVWKLEGRGGRWKKRLGEGRESTNDRLDGRLNRTRSQ